MEDTDLVNKLRLRNEIKNNMDADHEQLKSLLDEALPTNGIRQSNGFDYKPLISETVKELNGVFRHVQLHKSIPVFEINSKVLPVLSSIIDSLDLSRLLIALQGKDDYTLRHSAAVGILSALIGKWMKYDDHDQQSLLLAGVLHDIGKAQIPVEILNKPGKLTSEEYELMKKHTIFGYQLLKNTVGISHRQALAALEHHERVDGSGYPLKINEEKISAFGRIVAVADVFHAMSTVRVYHNALPFYRVLKELQEGLFGHFDSSIVSIFIRNMMEFLTGDRVQLSDGKTGTIIWINPNAPLRPLIKIEDEFLDLSVNTSTYIKELVE